MPFAPVEKLIEEIARGSMVILVDSEDRENEGDFVVAAEKATPEVIRVMATLGRGLICAPVVPAIADRLGLAAMGETPLLETECAFTISVDAREGITTGISAFDRSLTVKMLADAEVQACDLKRPGHIFPLRSKIGGVLERAGHTEAATDLARLAGLEPAAAICEIMNDDGTMARLGDLEELAEREGYLIGSIEDLIAWRKENDPQLLREDSEPIKHLANAELPTPMGVFQIHVFENSKEEEVVALTLGMGKKFQDEAEVLTQTGGMAPNALLPDLVDDSERPAPLVRLHSACFTGDVLSSLRCDCGSQLNLALRQISEAGSGVLIYLPQEGRGIGLAKKIEAYSLQQKGMDTVQANHALGFAADLRSYEDAAQILKHFGLPSIRLMTNNPQKIAGLESLGIKISERVAVETKAGPVNVGYLKTKKSKLGHFFEAV